MTQKYLLIYQILIKSKRKNGSNESTLHLSKNPYKKIQH